MSFAAEYYRLRRQRWPNVLRIPPYYASLPQAATWTVVELALMVAQGRRIAQREGARNLFFTSDITAPDSCDILMAAGSLQYMARSVPSLLELRSALPRWLLLNKLPLGLADRHGTGARSDGNHSQSHLEFPYYVFPQVNKATLSERVPG